MANYKQVSYGSRGSDVTELQKLLNKNGYTLTEDGIFGDKTRDAVRDYQKKNSLAVDGIVGTNTWGALTKDITNTDNPTTDTPAKDNPEFKYDPYKPSDVVTQAEELLKQQLLNKPGAYQSAWQEQLNEILQKILNREEFSYDLNGDALYQQYKDQYMLQGKQAMMDTMGQAQAMTGGYGNSYAQTVGQQTYQGYLLGLNDKVPELYQLALSLYQMEGDEMYNQASIMAQQEEQDYGRYRDQLSDYFTELERLYNQYNTERDFDYQKWAEEMGFLYQQERDKKTDEQWEKEFEEAKRQFEMQYNLSASKSSGGGGGSYSSSTPSGTKTGQVTGTTYSNAGYSTDIIKQVQRMLGVTEDGIWGPQSQAALEKNGFKDLQTFVESRGIGKKSTNPTNPTGGGGNNFTGSTYSEAAAYLKSKGLSASGLMTQAEWQRHRNGKNSAGGEHEASNYAEYLAAFIYGKLGK